MKKLNVQGFSGLMVIVLLAVAGIVGGTGWYVYNSQKKTDSPSQARAITTFEECAAAGNPIMESFPEQCAANGQTFVKQIDNNNQAFNGAGWEDIRSAKGGFTVSIPQGWEELLRAQDIDGLMIKDTKQPTESAGKEVQVADVEIFCCHGPNVFSLRITDNFAEPQGDSTEITINNGDKTNVLTGKKYVYEYPADFNDTYVTRIKGDRDYAYVFNLSASKNLIVQYSVYASDPRNQIETIDALVQSIRVHQ